MSEWKYNLEKHSVDEQPEETEFGTRGYSERYQEHLESLLSIPVSGKVEWKDGEDVTGKFKISKSRLSFADDRQHDIAIPIKLKEGYQVLSVEGTWTDVHVSTYVNSAVDKRRKVAIPKQEQPIDRILKAFDWTNKSQEQPRDLNPFKDPQARKRFEELQSQQPEIAIEDLESVLNSIWRGDEPDKLNDNWNRVFDIVAALNQNGNDSDAVEFYKWLRKNYNSDHAKAGITIEELYKLFKQSKSLPPIQSKL